MDGDDTLFMTCDLYLLVYEEELARHGQEFTAEERSIAIGKPAILLLDRWNQMYNLARDVDKWYSEFRKRLYGPRLSTVRMRPGADQLLDALEAQSIPHALVTNAPRLHVEKLSLVFPRLSRFPWVTRDDPRLKIGEHKPHPRPFVLGAETLGVDVNRCAAFGDTDNDTIGARKAGCFVVGLPHERSPAHKLVDAHLLLPDLRDFRLDMIPPLPLSP